MIVQEQHSLQIIYTFPYPIPASIEPKPPIQEVFSSSMAANSLSNSASIRWKYNKEPGTFGIKRLTLKYVLICNSYFPDRARAIKQSIFSRHSVNIQSTFSQHLTIIQQPVDTAVDTTVDITVNITVDSKHTVSTTVNKTVDTIPTSLTYIGTNTAY